MKKQIINETHHHWHGVGFSLAWILKWFLALLIISSLITLIGNESDNKQIMYKNCLDACNKPYDFWSGNVDNINYNIGECISNCNNFYNALNTKSK